MNRNNVENEQRLSEAQHIIDKMESDIQNIRLTETWLLFEELTSNTYSRSASLPSSDSTPIITIDLTNNNKTLKSNSLEKHKLKKYVN